jgi:hypothetical protein
MGLLPLELRVEHNKYIGDLQFEFLKRFYDRESILKRYIRGDIDVHLHGVIGRRRCCLISRVIGGDTVWVNNRKRLMLVGIGHLTENLRPAATAEWLQPLNDCLVASRYTFEPPAMGLPSSWRIFNRKLCSLLDISRIEESKFINKIIECRAQVVYGFSNQDTENLWDQSWAVASDNRLPIGVVSQPKIHINMSRHIVHFFEEQSTFTFEPRQVVLCPTYSRMSIVKGWFHAIGLSHGEEEAANPSDSTRSRDSRADTGRVRDELRQGGEAGERITGSQPKEELSRTSPSHHPDGCTATHTRSGNPEDA